MSNPTDEQNLIIKLPFPGFYCSWYSDVLDNEQSHFVENEIERQIENDMPEHLRLSEGEYADIFMNVTKYSTCYTKLASWYVNALNQYLKEKIKIDLGLRFESMDSPREYNFSTDRVYALISKEMALELYAISLEDNHKFLRLQVKERFTSRSGFVPFYDDNLTTWKADPLEWDHNELETLLLAVMDARSFPGEWDYEVFLNVIEEGGDSQAWEAGVDWLAFEKKVEGLRAEKLEAWKLENPDQEPPQPRCNATAELPL